MQQIVLKHEAVEPNAGTPKAEKPQPKAGRKKKTTSKAVKAKEAKLKGDGVWKSPRKNSGQRPDTFKP